MGQIQTKQDTKKIKNYIKENYIILKNYFGNTSYFQSIEILIKKTKKIATSSSSL